MTLVDRVLELSPRGGRYGLGSIQGEMDIHPDDWHLSCHFIDDHVMPGTLMYECCLHTFRVFLLRLGWVAEAGSCWYEPVPGITSRLECRGQVGAAEKARALGFIKLVGLSGFEEHYPHELSGGMQQRCNLARALSVDPEVLIMDEPFAALDAQTREIMQSELLRIWREAKKTVLFITHQINEAIYLGDRIIIFCARPGKVKDALNLDLPRPRGLAVKRSKQFLEYEDYVWNQIEEEVKKTMAADQVVHNIDA